MPTADVRIDGPAEEKQTASREASQDADPADGPSDGTQDAGDATAGTTGAGTGSGTGIASGEVADADGEDGAWDDGLIARRSRGAAAPGERPGRSRAAALWGMDPASAPDAGTAEDIEWEFAGAAGQSERTAASRPPSGDVSRGVPGGCEPGNGPSVEWPPAGAHTAQGRRVAALRRLVDLSRSRIPERVLAEAQHVLDSARARDRLSSAYTTVAIAGATGSGKSSLFNALAGTRLSQAGMRRPTTSTPVACSWEVPGAGPVDGVLDRLAIPPSTRRLMRPESDWRGRIDSSARSELEGLVLIDLPDHDSAAAGHREQVDRLLRLVDAVVWVLDPEKYADAVLHERYLRPLAGYAEVTFIVLNQTDRLPGDATDAVLNDLRRLLDEDGMALGEHGEPGARVLATSALVGEGVDELRTELGEFVAQRSAAGLRLSADLDGVVERLRPVYSAPGRGTVAHVPAGLTDEVRESFADQLACAAGAVTAGQAAERAWLRHARRACGTPWAQLQQWYEERRSNDQQETAGEVPDVYGVPGAHDGADDSAHASSATDALPGAHPRVARPAVAHAVRTVVDQAAEGLPDAWRRSVRDAAWRGADGLPEALDEALRNEARGAGGGDEALAQAVPVPPRPVWWTLAFVGQLGLLALQVLGAVWVLATVLGTGAGEEWMGAALLLGGMLGGSLLAWGCRIAARAPAAEYGQREETRLRRVVAGCGQVRVLEPVAAELLRYREVREQYVIVAGGAARL